jgi:hypothetical protein
MFSPTDNGMIINKSIAVGQKMCQLLCYGITVHYLELLHDRLAVWEGR